MTALTDAVEQLNLTELSFLERLNEANDVHADAVQVAADRAYVASAVAAFAAATIWMTGAAADGVTDDSAVLTTAIAAMQPGNVLDLQGKTYAISASAAHNLPSNTTIKNGTIVMTGVFDQLLFAPRGTLTQLTYTGGTINADAVQLLNVAGLTASHKGRYLFVESDDLVFTAYKRSRWVRIDDVVGTTVTLDGRVGASFVTNPRVYFADLKTGIKFENVKFVGDPAKSQRAVIASYCIDSDFDVVGENVGHATIGLRRCIRSTFVYRGGNPAIETDNGLDYGGVIYDGCLMCSGLGYGTALRHVIANGNGSGVDIGTSAVAHGWSCKDSVIDFHSGVEDPAEIRAYAHTVRRPNTLSSQPIGLMYQGGGLVSAEVVVHEYDTVACAVQLLQNTVDSIDIRVVAKNPTATATRGLDVQVQKTGGSVQFIRTDVTAFGLTNVGSRVSSIDTSGSANGLVIDQIDTETRGNAAQYGDLIVCRDNHTILRSKQTGHVSGITAGNNGFLASKTALGTWNYMIQENCTVFGAAGAIGVRVINASVRSIATGCKVYGVGGALITTLAVFGHTIQTGNDYT